MGSHPSKIEGLSFEDIKDVGSYIKSLDDATRFQLIEDGVRVDLIIDGLAEEAKEVGDPEHTDQDAASGGEHQDMDSLLEERYESDSEIIREFHRMSAPEPQSILDPFAESDPAKLSDDGQSVPATEISGARVENIDRPGSDHRQNLDELAKPAVFRRPFPVSDPTPEDDLIKQLATSDIVKVLPGVGAALERRSKIVSAQLESGTNNEQSFVSTPVQRSRPKLNPITEGHLKDMPDDGRFILVAEMAGQKGRQDADQAEAERLVRFDAQRKMAQDLEDIKVGKVSTVWDRYGHPKAVRDLLGEEAYQSFVDDRLEAGIIAHATAGLHLLQDRDLFDIAEGATQPDAPHEKLADLVTPKVRAATAEHARDILDKRKTQPSDAVLLSSELAQRKEKLDAAFDAEEGVDVEEMDAFLFYHEAAQREIGIAETAIELIPPRWAGQKAELFETPKTANGIPMDRRARRIEVNQRYADLQQSFGPRTDDVISYSLARVASASVQPSAQRDSQLRT